MPAPTTLDFETKAIQARPKYPPEPVGLAIWEPGRSREYLAWGHQAGGNNCTKGQAAKRLRAIYRSGRELLFHNASFDLEVAQVYFGLALPPHHLVRDTMIEAFLYDPNERVLDLKSQAEIHLEMPPDERDEVRDWVYANVPGAKRLKKEWAQYMWMAPGDLVGRYAIGDIVRTRQLHDKIYMPWIRDCDLTEAYMRELRLLPILMEMGQRGVPVDADRLHADIEGWENSLDAATKWVRRRLGAPRLNVDSGDQLADAIERKKLVDEWVMTDPSKRHPKGQRSVSKDNIDKVLKDRDLAAVLRYRASMSHVLKNMARSWLAMAEAGNGRIYFEWNQVAQASQDGKKVGARTGRLSSNPNAQNMPRKPQQIVGSEREAKKILAKDDEANLLILPRDIVSKVEPLPFMRDYVTAGKGKVVLQRDFSQQEPRILAHFMEGDLMELYHREPFMDVHTRTTKLINERTGKGFRRHPVKQVLLAVIYARGIPALAASLGIPEQEAREIRKEIYDLFPGIKKLVADLYRRALLDQPIRTWGGRLYYVEPPGWNKKFGKWMSYEYKMINTLIQGSAADHTKQAMINYDETKRDGEMNLQVHDELVAGCPRRAVKSEMKILRLAMEGVEFDVPMISDGKTGPTFGRLSGFKDVREAA